VIAFVRYGKFLTPQDEMAQRLSLGLLAAWALLIASASLYPFDMQWRPLVEALKSGLPQLQQWRAPSQRDAVVNLLLYLPFGLLGSMALEKSHSAFTRMMLPILGAAALSLGIEVLQHALPPRDPSLADWALNFASAALGTVLAALYSALPVRPWSRRLQRENVGAAPLLLVALWLVAHLAPFVPRLRPGRIESAIEASLAMPFSVSQALAYLTCYLLLASLVNALFRRPYFWSALLTLVIASIAGRLFFVGQHLGPDEASAAVVALPIVALLRRVDPRGWDGHAFLLALGAFFAAALSPGAGTAADGPAIWLPFAELAGIPADPGALPLLERLFLGIGLAWLALDCSLRRLPPLPLVIVVALAAEFLQQWVAGRLPDTTDIAALLIGAALASSSPRIAPRV